MKYFISQSPIKIGKNFINPWHLSVWLLREVQQNAWVNAPQKFSNPSSQSVVTIVSLHDDKQQQDWPPDEESTRTLVRCFEWANVVLRKPLGSHSPCTKLKTHYSEQLHCYNNTLLNLVLSEHSPSDNVRIHIMVMLRNTECDVTRTSRVVIGI